MSLCISFGIIYVDLCLSTPVPLHPGSVRSTDELIESILLFSYVLFFIFTISIDFYSIYISAEIPHLFVHVVPIFHYFLCLSLDYCNKAL